MTQSRTRYSWLDLLRFLTALTVVLVHARGSAFVEYGALPADQQSFPIAAAYAMTRVGNEAVVMFFVLSGFLVGGGVAERIAMGRFKPMDYAIDRFTRIILPLIPALVLTAIIGLLMGHPFNSWHFLGNLLSLQGTLVPSFGGNAPLWSLAYEAWFYILAGTAGVVVIKKRLCLASTFLLISTVTVFTHLSTTYLICWLIGVFAHIRRPERATALYIVTSIVLLSYATAALQIGAQSASVQLDSYKNFFPSSDISRIVLASGMAVLIQQLILIRPVKPIAVWFDSTGTALAAFSYTLYLTHYPLIQAMTHFGVDRAAKIDFASVTRFLLMTTTCIVGAFALYVVFEKRTAQLRRLIKTTIAGTRKSIVK